MHWTSDNHLARFEKKFLLFESDLNKSCDILNFCGFREDFPEREIHNLYWDQHNFADFKDHLAGVFYRKKTRMRWYSQSGKSFLWPGLEIKVRQGDIGYKHRFDLKNQWDGNVESFLMEIKESCPAYFEELENCRPAIQVSYSRRYFRSEVFPGLRLTIDFGLKAGLPEDQILQEIDRQPLCEVKYPVSLHRSEFSSCLNIVAKKLKLKPTAYSKYMRSVSTVYNEPMPLLV